MNWAPIGNPPRRPTLWMPCPPIGRTGLRTVLSATGGGMSGDSTLKCGCWRDGGREFVSSAPDYFHQNLTVRPSPGLTIGLPILNPSLATSFISGGRDEHGRRTISLPIVLSPLDFRLGHCPSAFSSANLGGNVMFQIEGSAVPQSRFREKKIGRPTTIPLRLRVINFGRSSSLRTLIPLSREKRTISLTQQVVHNTGAGHFLAEHRRTSRKLTDNTSKLVPNVRCERLRDLQYVLILPFPGINVTRIFNDHFELDRSLLVAFMCLTCQ